MYWARMVFFSTKLINLINFRIQDEAMMDWAQVKEITYKYCGSLVDSWFVIFSIIGVVALVMSQLVADELQSKILLTVGSVIVATGTFSAFTRWLSVHGIVKKEMHNILFGDEYLKTEQGFDVVWNKMIGNAVNTHMPALAPYIHKEFLREYFPSKNELFYKEYHQTFDVYWHDKTAKIIKVKERCEITVQCGNASSHILKYGFNASFPAKLNLTYKVTDLKVNAVCHVAKVSPEKTASGRLERIAISYEVELVGQLEYRYFRTMERLISLGFEPFIQVGSSWHTYKPRVTVNCHDAGLKAYFTSTGTLKDFVTISGRNNSGYMEEQYPELMLRAQGYTVYFSEV